MATAKLTAAQTTVLNSAAERADGSIEPLPATIRGGARQKVITSLLIKGLIAQDETTGLHITDAGYAAVGRETFTQGVTVPDVKTTEPWPFVTPGEPTVDEPAPVAPPTPTEAHSEAPDAPVRKMRDNTKQVAVIEMLKRHSGVSIAEVCSVTGWQSHTVRGFFAGALKKKLRMNITSTKADGENAVRMYRTW